VNNCSLFFSGSNISQNSLKCHCVSGHRAKICNQYLHQVGPGRLAVPERS
jgi:hypothetical protein